MGKKNIILIVISLFLGIGLGVGGTVGAQMFIFKSTTSKVAITTDKANPSTGLVDKGGPLVPIGDFTMNLQGGSFLKTAITVEGVDVKSEAFLKSKSAFLKDTVNVVLSDKSLADVQTPMAREKLRGELMSKLNEIAQNKVVNVLFESFVYQ